MNNLLFSKIFSKLIIAIVIIALADLIYLNWWVVQRGNLEVGSESVETRVVEVIPSPSPEAIESPTASPAQEVPVETKVVEKETIVEKETQTIVQTAQKEIFIPLGSGSTNSNSYADLAGLEVTIDTTKYTAIDSVVFEASIRVEGGNGRAYAQLKNVTDNNPLIESMVSSTSGTSEVKVSGNIPILSGSKKYGVMAKTDITNFAAHVDNARIKITLK